MRDRRAARSARAARGAPPVARNRAAPRTARRRARRGGGEAKPGVPIYVSRKNDIVVNFPGSGATLEGVMHKEGRTEVIPKVDEVLEIMPLTVMHGALPILGYRIGNLAYITDMKSIPAESLPLLEGVKVLVVNALRFEKEHHSHQLVDDAIRFAREIGAGETYFTHLTHDIGTHDIANSHLPAGFHFAYDGQEVRMLDV